MSTLHRLFHSLTTEMERAAESATADAVHDLRVAIRRLAEALRLYAVPGQKDLRKRLRRIRKKAAEVRDRDIAIQLLVHHKINPADPSLNFLKGQRALAAEQLQRFLKRQLRHPFELPNAPSAPAISPPAVETLFAATDLHQRRIAAKRLRYALEILQPGNLRAHAILRKAQKDLGEIHDATVTADRIFDLPVLTPPARSIAKELRFQAFRKEEKFLANWPDRALFLLRKS